MKQEATGLQSLAAEGGILATDASRGRSLPPFVRVHGAELAKAARTSAGKLAKGDTSDARSLAALAGRISRDLDRLAHSGSDRSEQRRLAAALERSASKAERIGEKL